MDSGSSKRSSDDCVTSDNKKKKISKQKRISDMLVEKTTTPCNKDIKQKKAFFAYFGKSFVENSENNVNCNVDTEKTKVNGVAKSITSTDDDDDIIEICVKKITDQKNSEHTLTNTQLIRSKVILPYVSLFVEELGYFPKFTHCNRLAPLSFSNLKLHLNNDETLNYNNFKNTIFSFYTSDSFSKRLVLEPQQIEINHPYIISSMKKSIPNFPVSVYYKQMKKKNLMAKKSETNIECMWIDKYKPMLVEEMLGNNDLLKSLKTWLEPNKKKSKKSKKREKYYDDDDYIFNSDSDSSHKAQHNLAILLGPSGCGKTSAVYAIANELDANVIELNASCNRTGKRIITDFIEATQSHTVEKNCLLDMMKDRRKIRNLNKEKNKNEKMTIILIEDADIFFDNYDEGFLSAITTLATDSKRPLVLTANDPYNTNLLKFISSNEITLNFIHPPKNHLSCFLQLMALNESTIISEDEINTFIDPIKPDIRQSIIQLQYVLSTGRIDQKTVNSTFKRNINSIWWNWPNVIGCDSTNIKNITNPQCNMDIAAISKSLDSMSTLNLIYSKIQGHNFLDAQPFWNHIDTKDSASLIETHYWANNSFQLSTDITEWIYNNIHTQDYDTKNFYPFDKDLNCRQRTWNISKSILEQIGLNYCNRKNETCFDYLSAIRSLSQNQQVNQTFGNLRNSKIFSYLRRINIDINNEDLKYLCNSMHSNFNCNQQLEISDQF